MKLLSLFLTFLIALIPLRVILTGELYYGFLIWNLLLALLPFCLSSWALQKEWKGRARYKLLALALVWLFFLPNAPYILTDFYHLPKREPSMLWFDIWMLFSYSLAGLVLFYLSLDHAEMLWKKQVKRGVPLFAPVVIVLCAYAIYLGRYLRFNSWDLVTDPLEILQEMVDALSTSLFWGITLPFFFFMMAGYLGYRRMKIPHE